jgi:hypothetical protein
MTSESAPKYIQLAKNANLLGRQSLWLGPDHLLLVMNAFSVENYRRWYFKDIQALIASRSNRRLIGNLVAAAIGLLCAIIVVVCIVAASDESQSTDRNVLFVFAGIFGGATLICAIFALVNSLRGPGCATFVQTPLGVEKLALPVHQRSFDRIVARLRPIIEAAQAKTEAAEPTPAAALAEPSAARPSADAAQPDPTP